MSNKPMFTKGPWEKDGFSIRATNGYVVCRIDPPKSVLRGKERYEAREYCNANARLISASTDLFLRLQESMEMLERIAEGKDWGAIEDQINDNRAAIAKALGEEE